MVNLDLVKSPMKYYLCLLYTSFKEKLKQNLNNVNTELKKIYSSDELDFDDIADKYLNAAKIIRPYVADTSIIVQDYIKSGKKVLFEGAQGTMLDVNYGTYHYVTSSHPTTAGVCVGAGIPPTAINEAIGIAKAYTTRVGKGPFPTELLDKTGDLSLIHIYYGFSHSKKFK